MSYMQQRYMDPQLRVFLSIDPVTAYEQPVGQFNRYRYANGNPYKFRDLDGRIGETAWDVAMGATSAYSNFSQGNAGSGIAASVGVAIDATAAALPFVP
ncbi:MAG: RHS repeat-associated core domain-containing protein [Stenotrophomonas sp.]